MKEDKGTLEQILYQESANFVRQQESLLFQRLNYSLVSIAFLVAGFVELAVPSAKDKGYPVLTGLTVLVGTTGFLISLIFTAINYFNSRNLGALYENRNLLEKILLQNQMASDDELPYNSDMSKMKDFKIKGLLRQFKKDCIKVHRFRIPKEDFKPLWAFHTWLIPFYSSVFWLLMLSVYCGFVFQSWTPALVIGIPILVLIGLSCITENVSLVRKNPDTWQTVQGPSGKYSYKLVGTSISGKFNGHGFAAGTAYTLVSYKDGDNIVELGNGTANAHGDLKIMNGRINIGAAQKWTGDYLGQQIGYKIWLVPTRDITAGKLTWHPNGFLFETGLITALDTNNKDTRSE